MNYVNLNGNKVEKVYKMIDIMEAEGVIVSVDAEDIMGIIYRTNADSIHFIGEICEENMEIINKQLWDNISENEEADNDLINCKTQSDVKKIVRKYGSDYCIHISKNHLIVLVY